MPDQLFKTDWRWKIIFDFADVWYYRSGKASKASIANNVDFLFIRNRHTTREGNATSTENSSHRTRTRDLFYMIVKGLRLAKIPTSKG